MLLICVPIFLHYCLPDQVISKSAGHENSTVNMNTARMWTYLRDVDMCVMSSALGKPMTNPILTEIYVSTSQGKRFGVCTIFKELTELYRAKRTTEQESQPSETLWKKYWIIVNKTTDCKETLEIGVLVLPWCRLQTFQTARSQKPWQWTTGLNRRCWIAGLHCAVVKPPLFPSFHHA